MQHAPETPAQGPGPFLGAGIGLRTRHFDEVLSGGSTASWFHSYYSEDFRVERHASAICFGAQRLRSGVEPDSRNRLRRGDR